MHVTPSWDIAPMQSRETELWRIEAHRACRPDLPSAPPRALRDSSQQAYAIALIKTGGTPYTTRVDACVGSGLGLSSKRFCRSDINICADSSRLTYREGAKMRRIIEWILAVPILAAAIAIAVVGVVHAYHFVIYELFKR